jgi:hypothetical protein
MLPTFNPFDTNLRWARNVADDNPYVAGSFVFGIAGAFLLADDNDRVILNDALTQLREKYPVWDIPEKEF